MTDLDPSAGRPTSRVHFYEDTSAHRLYVQWSNVQLWGYAPNNATAPGTYSAANGFTLQVVLCEDGSIQLNYKRVPFNPATAIAYATPGVCAAVAVCWCLR